MWFFKGRAGSWSRELNLKFLLWGRSMEEAGRNTEYKVMELSSGVGTQTQPRSQTLELQLDADGEAGEAGWAETRSERPGLHSPSGRSRVHGPEVTGAKQPRHFRPLPSWVNCRLAQAVGLPPLQGLLLQRWPSNAPESVPGEGEVRHLCSGEKQPGPQMVRCSQEPIYEPSSCTSHI